MRQLGFKVRRLLFLNRYSFAASCCYIYTRTERRGNRQVARETERESVRVWERCAKTDSASVVKLTVGKNPVDQFWDKLGCISIFWRNYFNGGLIEKIHER